MGSDAPEALTLDITGFVAGETQKNAEWDEPTAWMTRAPRRHSIGRVFDLSIWFDYVIPGWIAVDGMDYEGDKRGAFLRSIPRFVVAMKLPEQPPRESRAYLARRTRAALSVVEGWRQARRFSGSIATARDLLDAVVDDAEAAPDRGDLSA